MSFPSIHPSTSLFCKPDPRRLHVNRHCGVCNAITTWKDGKCVPCGERKESSARA